MYMYMRIYIYIYTYICIYRQGDLVEIVGLTSEAGQKHNGFYGRIVGYDEDKGRYAVKARGHVKQLLIRPENLTLTMKEEEMSDSDESFFHSLDPQQH